MAGQPWLIFWPGQCSGQQLGHHHQCELSVNLNSLPVGLSSFFIFCSSWSVKVKIESTYFTDSSLSWILVCHELPASKDIKKKKEKPRKAKPRPTLLSGGQRAATASWYRDGVIWPLVWNLDSELIQEQYWLNKFAMKLKWNLPDQNTRYLLSHFFDKCLNLKYFENKCCVIPFCDPIYSLALITPFCPGRRNCVCFAGAQRQLMRLHINLVNMQQWHTVVERGKGADTSTCNLHF